MPAASVQWTHSNGLRADLVDNHAWMIFLMGDTLEFLDAKNSLYLVKLE